MGKNYTIYFHDDVAELIGTVEGKGTLINELIREHYSNDEETLRRKVSMAEQEFNALNARLKLKVEQRHEAQEKINVVKKLSAEEDHRKKALEKWKKLMDTDKIDVDKYMSAFDKKGKFIPSLAKQ